MKELDFMKKINDIDPALLGEASAPARRARPKLLGRLAAAAAAVILLGGTVYAVVSQIELRKTDKPETEEQGIEARTQLPLVSWSGFTGEIQTVGKTIARQYAEGNSQPVFSSVAVDPGDCTVQFAGIDQAMEYIGLSGLKTPSFPFEDCECSVTAHGDAEGRVESVRLWAQHIVRNDIGATETVTILTENAPESDFVSEGMWTCEYPRDVEFLTYTTPGGLECRIAVLRPQYDSEYMSLDGYLAVGSGFYELNLGAVPVEKYDQALEMLHHWADAMD